MSVYREPARQTEPYPDDTTKWPEEHILDRVVRQRVGGELVDNVYRISWSTFASMAVRLSARVMYRGDDGDDPDCFIVLHTPGGPVRVHGASYGDGEWSHGRERWQDIPT